MLSDREVVNSEYGFASGSTYVAARKMNVSDYARSTGAYMDTRSSYFGCGFWWLRSPSNIRSNLVRCVGYSGYAVGDSIVYDDSYGVVPALNIIL